MKVTNVKILAVAVAALVIISAITAIVYYGYQEKTVLKVFTAGSLAEPFGNAEDANDMESLFEETHPNVDVQVSSGGSAYMIRKVTDLGQSCDVLASADYSLIPPLMINATEKTADFVIEFARNSMVLAYTEMSAFHDEINDTNWFEILRRNGVKFGFSNPNHDPCGYRSQMTIQLAEIFYGDDRIYDDLIMNNTNMLGVEYDDASSTYEIKVPSDLKSVNSDKIMIRDAEVDLTSSLEAGAIDYLFIYESVAYRHSASGEMYIELPREINLNDTDEASNYATIWVTQFADNEDESKVKTVIAKPIVYGITIPTTAEQPELALEFLEMVLSEEGQEVMSAAGQQPIVPAHAGYWKSYVPEGIREMVS